jgi:hypothetical protein
MTDPIYYVFEKEGKYYCRNYMSNGFILTSPDINDTQIIRARNIEEAENGIKHLLPSGFTIVPVYENKKSLVDKIVENCK